MNQPFTYGELLAKHAKVSQDPEFKDLSLPDYAAAMNEVTGSQNYDQGLKDDFVRRASHKVDEAIDWTGLPQRFQSVGEGLTSILGGGPEYQQAVGQAFRGLPRTLGEIGVGVGAAALATAAAPVAIPAGGIAAGGIALGTMTGLTGARTYGETGSIPQAGVSAATMLAGMKASEMVGQPILRAMGAPTVAEFAGKVAPEFAAKVGASFAPKEIGELLVASTYPQQIAKVTGMMASQIPVNELGSGIQRRMQTGEWSMPSGPEFAASTAGLLPFLGYDMYRDVQNPMRTFNKKVKPALQDSFVQRGVKDYVAKHGEMPPDNQIAALAREAEILPPLTGPNFKIGDDGRFEAKFNSTAEATEWAQSHASRFNGFDLEARNGITYLKVKPKDVADFLELTGNNENNSFLESRNKSFTYQDAGAENVMATVMKYKQRFTDAVNEGKPEGQRISEMDLVDDELVRHISDAHRVFEQEQMAAGTKSRPTQDDIINRAIKINTVETEFGRDLAVKIDPAHLATERAAVDIANREAADALADAAMVERIAADPAAKSRSEYAAKWYNETRGYGAKVEAAPGDAAHGRTRTAIVGKASTSPEAIAIDKEIVNVKQQIADLRDNGDLFNQEAVQRLDEELQALVEKRAELPPEKEAAVVDESVEYDPETGLPVEAEGIVEGTEGVVEGTEGAVKGIKGIVREATDVEVSDPAVTKAQGGLGYLANAGVSQQDGPKTSAAVQRAAVSYKGTLDLNDPASIKKFKSYLAETRTTANIAYLESQAQGRSQGIIESTRGMSKEAADVMAQQRNKTRTAFEQERNIRFEVVPDKKTGKGTFAIRSIDQNAIRSFEGNWKTERGDWADTEMESMIAQFVGKLEEGAQVEVAAEQGVHDLNDIRDPAVKTMRYQATVNNVASAMNDGAMHRELIRVLNLERNRKQESELKKAKARVLQYIDFVRKGGNLTWKISRKPAMREVFRTTDRAEAERYIQDRLTHADIGKTVGSRGEGLTVRDYQFDTVRAENNYNVLEEAIMNQFGDQVSVGYKVMEKPKDLPKGAVGGRRGFLTVELQGDLEGFNKHLLALSARTGVDYGGFVNEANADRSGRLNERRTNGLSPAEEILAALQAVGKQFQDPRKLYERPKGDFGFLPKPYWELGRDEKGKVTAHRLGLNDPETGAYIPAHEAVKTVKRGMDLAVPAGAGVMVKQRDGTMKEHKGNWATLVDDVFKSEGVVSFADFVSVMKASLEKDRNAKTGPQIDHYNRVLDMLLNKGNERNWAPNIPVGVAMAKELGHVGPDGLIDGVFGWYNHSRDTLQSSGMLFSPYYTHPKTGKVYQMSALEFLPHLIHEATHGNVAHGFDVDPVLKAQGIALVQHLKKQLSLDASWASITGVEPRTIRALRDPNREDYVSLQELAGDLLIDESLMRTLRGMKDDPSLGGNPKPMNNLFNRVMDWIKSYLSKVFPPGKGEGVVDGASLYDRLANYTARAMEVSDSRVRMEYKGDIYSAIAKEIFGSSRVDLLGSQRPEPSERTGDSGVGRVVGGKEPVKTGGLGWSRTIGDATRPKTAEDVNINIAARNEKADAANKATAEKFAKATADPNRPKQLLKVKQIEPTPSEEIAKQRTDALRAELQKEYPDATIIVIRPEKVVPKSDLPGGSGLVSWEGGRVEVRSKTDNQKVVEGERERVLTGYKDPEPSGEPVLVDQPLQFVQTILNEGTDQERSTWDRVKRPSGEFKMGAYREMISSVEGTEPVPAGPKSVPPKEKDRGPGLSAEDEAKVKERWPMGTSKVLESRGSLALGRKVFSDPAFVKTLNEWMKDHPKGWNDLDQLAQELNKKVGSDIFDSDTFDSDTIGLRTPYGRVLIDSSGAASNGDFASWLLPHADGKWDVVYSDESQKTFPSLEAALRKMERNPTIDVESTTLESRGLLQALPVRPVIGQKGPWLTPENQGLLKSLMGGSNRVVDAFMGTGKMSVAARLLGFQGQVVANEIHGVPASVLSRLTPELVTQAEQLAKQLEPLVNKPKEYNALVAAHPDKELARFVGSQANYMGRSLDKSPVHVPSPGQAYLLRSLGKRLKAWLDSEISVTQGDGFKLTAEAQAGDFVIFDPPYVGSDTYRVNKQTDGLAEIAQAVSNGAKVLYFNAYSPKLVKDLKALGLKVKREQVGQVDTVVAHSAIETQALESRGGLGQEPIPTTQFTVMTKDGPIEARSFGRTVFSEQATGKGAHIDNPNWKPESAPTELTAAAVKVKDGWLVGWLKPDGSFVTSNNQPRPTWEDASFEIGIRDTSALESRGPITVPEVTRALKHGTTAMIDKREEESGRLWFKGEPFILGSVRPQKEGEYGWWSLSTEDLQKMATQLGTKEELFANQVKSTPQITSAYPTLVEALAYQGMSKQEARKGALLIGRYATAFKTAPGYEATVVGRSASQDSLGFAWPSEGKVGLNPEIIADSADTRAGRFLLLREVFIHEMFHTADVKGTALAGIFDQLKTADARRDVLIASSYLNKGEFQGRTRPEAIEDSMEFSADLAANLVPSLLSGNPTAVMHNAATLLGPEVQQALFTEGIMHRKAMEIFSSKLAEKGQAEWAVPLTKEIQAYMKSFDQIQKDTEMFHVMRGLWPDAFMPEVMEVASQVETDGRRRLFAASKETLQDSVLESRGMLRAEIGLSNNAKYSWWNKTLANFNRLADQFPILRPHWDMLHSASAQAQNATMDLKLIMAGQYQAGKYKSDARSKRWRQFNMTPRLLEAHDKLVMLANQMGDTANIRMTPLEQNTFLERSGKLTDPADRALVLEVFNSQLAQNEIVGGMINKAERHRDDVMLARLASKRGAGTVSLEQARAQGKLVGDWAEASFMGDIVTASDLANRMATEIPQDVRNELVELAQALVTPRMEAYNTRQRGIGYWMPERRFGQWGLYYKDQNGDVQRHYFQQAKELETFKARARVKDDDIVKLIGPAESEPNFGANPALFAALDEAQAQQVAAVRKHLGDAAADFLQKEGHFTAHVVGNLQAANPTSTSLKRTFGATRQFLTMSDVQQQYIEAAVNSIKNRTVQAENELILGDQSFAMQPESKILVRQHVDQFLKRDSEFGRKVQMANFVYFMGGNISSMVLEPFQQLMALAPVLTHNGAGLAGGYKLIADANALWAKAKMSGSFGNPDYDAAMKQWRLQGDADNGIYAELNHNEDLNLVNTIRQSGGFSQFSPYDLLKNKVYALANFATKFYLRVPAYNSEIALLASYKLLRSQGLPHEEATKQAVFLKEGAMFGGGKRNRPVGLFGFNRTAAQVMSSLQGYSLGMTSLMGQLVRESLGGKGSGLSPAQITQARKAAAQMLMTQFAAAGALGMPFMAAALTGLQKLFPGTNPEQATRDFLDDFDKEDKAMGGVVGTFLAKGLPALMSNGPDMSSRFALGGVLGVNPYNGWTLANLAGPSVSLVTNIFNAGREAAMTGDPAALKPMMPIGLQKMYDAATQGSSFKDAKGRMLAEDLTGTEQAARFAGFTPNRVAETRDTTRLAKINESAARERTTRLANQLADLYQAGEVERVREKILDLEPHEQSTMVQAVASRLEQKTMPADPRTIGSRMSLRSQQELFHLMQTGRVQLPTQQERMMLHGQVAMGLAIPGTQPPSNRSMGRAAAIDMLQQQSPALSKEAASLLLDRRSGLSPQARSDMFPGDTATGL